MLKRKTIFWRLLPSYWTVILVSLLIFTAYTYISANRFYAQELEKGLKVRAELLHEQMVGPAAANDSRTIDTLCKLQGRRAETRFTVIDLNGVVLGDSDEDPSIMKNHRDRAEIGEALNGNVGAAQRYSQTLRQQMMYVALPLQDANGEPLAVIRAALPMNTINQTLQQNWIKIIAAAALIGFVAMLLCTGMTSRITTPLRNLKHTADRYAHGDFSHKAPTSDTEEIHQVAEAMNLMANKLDERLNTIHEQQNELKAILSGLTEGVIAIDSKERIINLNNAAAELLEIDKEKVTGHSIQEAIRFTNLQKLIHHITTDGKNEEAELTIYGETEKRVQIYGTALGNIDHEPLGVLIVLRDITRLKHLEGMRKDFVANVSHELRTPITSIKGFVETMLESAEEFGQHARFLEIVSKQANRLNAIIDDLLTLSRLEQKGTNKEILLTDTPLKEVLNEALEICERRAREKRISIDIECEGNLTARINQALIEQAFVNLIDNAIKYSDANGAINISAVDSGTKVEVSVQDKGYGIDQQHLPRLFERFYRVDTARSRKLGGTGLGLAIVKHIINCHGGDIKVESEPGIGSTFTIELPKT
ncbi:two-component system histidine kinase PnpS [Verrucomicrobiota bacterium]